VQLATRLSGRPCCWLAGPTCCGRHGFLTTCQHKGGERGPIWPVWQKLPIPIKGRAHRKIQNTPCPVHPHMLLPAFIRLPSPPRFHTVDFTGVHDKMGNCAAKHIKRHVHLDGQTLGPPTPSLQGGPSGRSSPYLGQVRCCCGVVQIISCFFLALANACPASPRSKLSPSLPQRNFLVCGAALPSQQAFIRGESGTRAT
jgi:hypothetical protein